MFPCRAKMATIARYKVCSRELALAAFFRGETAIARSRRQKSILVTWQLHGHAEVLRKDSHWFAGAVPDSSHSIAMLFGSSSAGPAAVDCIYFRGENGRAVAMRKSADSRRPCREGLVRKGRIGHPRIATSLDSTMNAKAICANSACRDLNFRRSVPDRSVCAVARSVSVPVDAGLAIWSTTRSPHNALPIQSRRSLRADGIGHGHRTGIPDGPEGLVDVSRQVPTCALLEAEII